MVGSRCFYEHTLGWVWNLTETGRPSTVHFASKPRNLQVHDTAHIYAKWNPQSLINRFIHYMRMPNVATLWIQYTLIIKAFILILWTIEKINSPVRLIQILKQGQLVHRSEVIDQWGKIRQLNNSTTGKFMIVGQMNGK